MLKIVVAFKNVIHFIKHGCLVIKVCCTEQTIGK